MFVGPVSHITNANKMYFTDSEKGRAATRVVKMSAEKTVIHNPHPGTNTKVSKNKLKTKKIKIKTCQVLQVVSLCNWERSSEVMEV